MPPLRNLRRILDAQHTSAGPGAEIRAVRVAHSQFTLAADDGEEEANWSCSKASLSICRSTQRHVAHSSPRCFRHSPIVHLNNLTGLHVSEL
mmetsp:Transcript_45747/g.94599  ORF Transcript_45747/g.94599 Transcript_45747/m.94599 type:complete len:92 (-) Transcript_45747:388-663(-)